MKTINPPEHLSEEGKLLFSQVQEQYDISDAPGIALLASACLAFERMEEARRLLAAAGTVVVKDRFGQAKPHPACGIEHDAHIRFLAALRALRLAPEDHR